MKVKLVLFSLLAFLFTFFPSHVRANQAGTTLNATKTAQGIWERFIEYDWTINKSSSLQRIELAAQESQTIGYSLTVTKQQTSQRDSVSVAGQICVTNGGDIPTENLKLTDQVEYKTGSGQFQSLFGAQQVILPAQLAAGESKCYPYSIVFNPVPNAQYRNAVKVTITNHSGHLGQEFGPEPKADFTIPSVPTIIETDEQANLQDVVDCPPGFTCQSSFTPIVVSNSQVINYDVLVTNASAQCGTSYLLNNIAGVTEVDSQTTHNASVSIELTTPACVILSCTYTQGYWKNHPQAWPTTSLFLGTRLYSQSELMRILKQPVKGNGLINLAHQLIASKLNIAFGATDPATQTRIVAADNIIGSLIVPPIGSDRLSTSLVSILVGQFDAYNNGLVGPGHCE